MRWTLEHEGIVCSIEADEETATEALRLAVYAMVGVGFTDQSVDRAIAELDAELTRMERTPFWTDEVDRLLREHGRFNTDQQRKVDKANKAPIARPNQCRWTDGDTRCLKDRGHEGIHSWEHVG